MIPPPSSARARLVSVLLLSIASAAAAVAATPAGTVIRNQASASYTDADGRRVSVTSNLVETTVEQVPGLELENDRAQRAVGGQRVSFSHRLRNTGNGDDRYTLVASDTGTGSVPFADVAVYLDLDVDGVADSALPLSTTPWVAAGDELHLIVSGTLPGVVVDGDSARLVLSATSRFDGLESRSNTDTVTVGTGGAVTVTKSMSATRGPSPSGPWTVTLRYANTGTGPAGNVTLIDALSAGMRYVPGSGVWSESGAALTDDDPTDAHAGGSSSLRWCAYDPSCTGLAEADADTNTDSRDQVTAVIDLVPIGASGTVAFDVEIAPSLAAGRLLNLAEFEYDIAVGSVPRTLTNAVPFDVLASAGVVANGSVATSIDFMSEPVQRNSAPQGGTVRFDNIVWNTGNRTDTFNMSVDSAGSTFPAGTIWRLLRENGATPLLDTDGDGLPDTGPVRPGEFARVVLTLTLPPGVSGDNGGVGFDLTKTARSATDASVANDVTDHLDEIVANVVDVTNQAPAGSPGALGAGPGPEPDPVSTVAPDDAGIARFDLHVRHQGSGPDRYRLAAHGSADGGPLPEGWQVRFVDPASGATLADTGALGSGASRHVVAEVRLPAEREPGVTSVWFEAFSALTGARDLKHDAVGVAGEAVVRIEPGLAAQLEPGGSIVYSHIVTNTGNASVADVLVTLAQSLPGWTATAYVDTDGDGALGPGDTPFESLWMLGPGESRDLFVRVNAPPAAPLAQRNATTVTVSSGGTDVSSVVDLSTISLSTVAIRKEQALDAGCDGVPDAGTDFGTARLEIAPGDNCVLYRLTAINQGLETSWNVKIHDITPPYTLYRPAASCSRTPCWVSEPDAERTGTISAETDQLLPGDSFWLQFSVRVD